MKYNADIKNAVNSLIAKGKLPARGYQATIHRETGVDRSRISRIINGEIEATPTFRNTFENTYKLILKDYLSATFIPMTELPTEEFQTGLYNMVLEANATAIDNNRMLEEICRHLGINPGPAKGKRFKKARKVVR